MGRYRGIGMPKAKKTKFKQTSESIDEPPALQPATEPPNPPSPDAKQVKHVRPPQSPGMKVIKAAAYDARKAKRLANKANAAFVKAFYARVEHYRLISARMQGILSSWKKTGNKNDFSHLERWHKAEMELEKKHISTLEAEVLAGTCACDAKDAELAEKHARIARLARLLRARKCKGWTRPVTRQMWSQ